MSGVTMTAAQLLKMEDGEFESSIQDMNVKKLLELISVLQREMGKEQENFNSLSSELPNLKKNSGQYKSVSKEMAASQKRLTALMNRSMKCFSQQGQQQNKEAMSSSQKSAPQNRNPQEVTKPKVNTTVLKPFVEVKDTKPSDQPVSNGTNQQVLSTGTSFADAKSKFNGNIPNGANRETKAVSSVDIKRSHSMVNSTDSSKRWSADVSNGTSVDSRPKSDFDLVKSTKVPNTEVAENNASSAKVSTKAFPTSASTSALGPMAGQSNKFISKSSDTLYTTSNGGKDVVQGKVPQSKTMIVMNADRQYMDLDSFTDRKNLLSELKSFDKELKPVAKTDPLTKDHASKQPKLIKSFGSESVPQKDDKPPVQKSALLSDIKLSKKPSDVKKVTNGDERNTNNLTTVKTNNKVDVKQETNPNTTKKVGNIHNIKAFYEVNEGNSNRDTRVVHDTEAATSEITLRESVHTGNQSDESGDQSSDHMSEDEDKFVTEFSFPQKQAPSRPALNTMPSAIKTEPVSKPINKHENVQTNKPVVQTYKPSATPVVSGSGSQSNQKSPGRSHVVKDNEEVLGAAARNQPQYNEDGEELVKQDRVNYSEWDPTLLLADLYRVNYMPDNIEDISHRFIGMEGLMEKLPMNKKKATLLKTWKRRFFRAKDGWLHYYETSNRDKPSDSLQLMGGKVEELGNRVLGIDDGRGKFLMVRVPTENEYGQWKVALDSQTADNVKATYVRPAPASAPNPKKRVVVIDIGSSGIRAGILGERGELGGNLNTKDGYVYILATLPHVFFPSVVAINKTTKEVVVGADAYRPEIRKASHITYPIRPSNRIDKFNIDMEIMGAMLKKVFSDLQVNPKEYLVMLSTPQVLGNPLKEGLMRIFINQLHVKGVCMVQQALLSLYSYNAMSGIIVDIGERLEILPIYEGLLIESGLCHQAYGGTKVQDSMYISLLQNRYQFTTPVGRLIVRYICEQSCHVVENYKDAKEACDKDGSRFTRTINLQDFQLPEGAHRSVSMDNGCFKSPEGFFNTDLWEMDYKNLQKQIFAAIQQCPMDARKQMYRSIYLSGGVTMIPGFAERLQLEMEKLAPPAAVVEVHASPQRYHSAYIGACAVALMDVFEMSCVMAEEWNKMGVQACRKWGTN